MCGGATLRDRPRLRGVAREIAHLGTRRDIEGSSKKERPDIQVMLANLAAVAAVAWGPTEIVRVPGHVVLRAASPRAGAPVAGDSSDLETDFDEVLRRELEKAFAGMKVDALDDTEESRFRLIEAETQRVLSAVLEEMDAGSDALRAQLEAKAARPRKPAL